MEILSLGEKIKRRRKELNMTLKSLAGDRITPGQISLVESGKSNPSMDLLEYIAKELKTSIEYLMESEEVQAEKNCTYFENIAESYIINNDLVQGEKYIENALYYAEKYNLEYKIARSLYLKGKISFISREYPVAQQLFLSANVVFIKNNNYEEIIKTFVYLGKTTMKLQSFHASISYFGHAEKVYRDNDFADDYLLGKIYYYIACVYFRLDNIKKAINYSYLAKEKFRKMENSNEYARTMLLIADEYSKKNDLDNAVKYSRKALEIYNKINDFGNIARIENNLGKLFYEFDNIEESFVHLNKSRELRIRIKDPDIGETLKNICINYIKLKDVKSAKKVLEEILSAVEDGDNAALVGYYILGYKVAMLENNKKEAENILIMALNFVKNMGFTDEIGQISILLGKFYMSEGNDTEAAKYLRQGVDLFKELDIMEGY
ncbi:helix-turn-helix domain-containing protein [Clostridium sp. LBM24168]